MAKINTDLNTNVQLENAPTPEAVSVGSGAQIVGKSGFDQLADTLASINPAIKALADKRFKEQNEQKANEGAAKINGMTLEESKTAHKNGFPDIYNGWARFGAYKQYANNSADKFIQDFKQDYWSQRNTPNYNWQDHYSEYSEKYLADKGDDEFFASAYNESTATLRKWLNGKEFEKQSDNLITKIRQSTSYDLQAIPHKVEEELEIAFYEDELMEEMEGEVNMNVKDYAERKQKYFAENQEKMFESLYYNVKNNKNPALDNADFDDILIQEAKTHALIDGRYANSYIKFLTQNKPDGTPSTLNNPSKAPAVREILSNLKDSNELVIYSMNRSVGNVAQYPKSKRKDFDNKLFDKELAAKQAQGMTSKEAFLSTVVSLEQTMRMGEPIGRVEDLLSKPLSALTTEDSTLALEVYNRLDKAGLAGIYFGENDKNKFHFFIANALVESGTDYRDVLKEVGNMEFRTGEILTLNPDDRNKLQGLSPNKAFPPNQELTQMIGQYFKNTMGDGYINATEQFIEKHYTDVNGRLISNHKINAVGVKPEEYDSFKIHAIELFKEKLNVEKDVIQETSLIGFYYDETNEDITGNAPNVNEGIDLNNFEIIVNYQDDTISFKEDLNSNLDVPATVEYKDGKTVWLEIPIQNVLDRKTKFDTIATDKEIARQNKAENLRRKREKASDEIGLEFEGVI